jgi:Fe2+ transport system protein FeoA
MKEKKKLKEIAKENILRVVLEETDGLETIEKVRKLSKQTVVPDIINSDLDEYFIDALKELEISGLVNIYDNKIFLTDKGKIKADKVFSKHLTIEDFFNMDYDETEIHRIADILEHFISKEVIKNMEQISSLKGYGIPLNDIISDEGIITELKIGDSHLFERLVSLGICPGQNIRVMAKLAPGVIIKIKNTQIAVDKSICDGIMVVMK